LIQVRKDAKASNLISKAERQAARQRLEAEKEELKLRSEAEVQALKTKLEAEVEEAKALAANPELLKLRQLGVLKELASTGGKFVIGPSEGDLSRVMTE